MIFIDTNIAIALRDMHKETQAKVRALEETPAISLMTRIELENGAQKEPAGTNNRRRLLDLLLRELPIVFFNHADIIAYGGIVYDLGFDRRLTLDRLIAAQAISRDARLITMNGADFRRIEGLRLEEWPAMRGAAKAS